MSLITILLALLIERMTIFIRPMRQHFWFEAYAEKLAKFLGKNGYLTVLFSVIPILIVLVIVQDLFHHFLYGGVYAVINLLVLLYCLGDAHLREQIEECYKLHSHDQPEQALESLQKNFAMWDVKEIDLSVLMQAFYKASLQRIFTVIFWFVIFGAPGCLAYRLIQRLSANMHDHDSSISKVATLFTLILDWIPSRLLAFSFCLVGHFGDIFTEWCASFKGKLSDAYQVLFRCGHVALKASDDPDPAAVTAHFDEAYALVNRSLFVWLVVFALIMLF
jgi:AmpE protein